MPTHPTQTTPISLEGLREAILTPRTAARDQEGMLHHPAIPVLDEDIDLRAFFGAFGIECRIIELEHDEPAKFTRWVESKEADCSYWTPSWPAGENWLLISIYMAEDGPVALFVRGVEPEAGGERRRRVVAEQTVEVSDVERIEMDFLRRMLARGWEIKVIWNRDGKTVRRVTLDLRDCVTMAPDLIEHRAALVREFVETAPGAIFPVGADKDEEKSEIPA